MSYHNPVLLNNSIEGLAIKKAGIYVDVTYGGGGHAKEILKNLGETGVLFGFDQDVDVKQNIIADKRLVFLPHNFEYISNFLKLHKVTQVDGILADLGVSSYQFDKAERGFSTRFDADLDMRMNQFIKKSAKNIVNEYEENDLRDVFFKYGEIKNSTRVARDIVIARADGKIETIERLKKITLAASPRGKENKFFAQLFQALRIEVNREMEVLEKFLLQTTDLLKPGGRLVVISYHSLEDRLVKNFMRSGKFKGVVEKDFYGNPITPFKQITRKPIVPASEELEQNSRARSAKLRIAEKI
jgi:16S rRNA (cytosine1402-N4)-methyltransferase